MIQPDWSCVISALATAPEEKKKEKKRETRAQVRMKKFKGALCLVLKMMEWFSPVLE